MITDETIKIERYINRVWPKFKTQKEIALRKLFPSPQNIGLNHIWKYGSADLVVFWNNKPICIIEPGGIQHFEDKQKKNDARKFKLCELNNCRCLHMINGLIDGLSKKQFRRLIGGYVYGKSKNKN